jgi:hypothetical protein
MLTIKNFCIIILVVEEIIMPREKKDGKFINYYIRREIYEELKKYSEEKGQTMTMALERILKEYLQKTKEED